MGKQRRVAQLVVAAAWAVLVQGPRAGLVSGAAVPTVLDRMTMSTLKDSLPCRLFPQQFATSPAAIHGLHLLIYGFRRYRCQFASRIRDMKKRR